MTPAELEAALREAEEAEARAQKEIAVDAASAGIRYVELLLNAGLPEEVQKHVTAVVEKHAEVLRLRGAKYREET